jgi:hypothetical protein
MIRCGLEAMRLTDAQIGRPYNWWLQSPISYSLK